VVALGCAMRWCKHADGSLPELTAVSGCMMI